ncbi:MAG TPA: YggT family protein [Gemmatimonadaceae bacterium]|nr:YggT family protein [Gemmatimonadaceae bacterium]
MDAFLLTFEALIGFLRVALFAIAAVLFVVFAIDWLVRTRRISPFSPVARFFRRTVHPVVTPIERRVVRAGGLPSSAPWWALVVAVVSGILLLLSLQYVRDQVASLAIASGYGARGVIALLVSWAFGILQIALLVRVIASWFRISEFSRWIRWAIVITEPIIRPLRRVIPPLGMIDITPLVAWLLLSLVKQLVVGSIL